MVQLEDGKIYKLYTKKETKEHKRGCRAFNCYKRVIDQLEVDLLISVDYALQWIEERSLNHHPRVSAQKWPIGLIRINPEVPVIMAQNIMNYADFRSFKFGATLAANTSGGVVEGKTEQYLYEIAPAKEFQRNLSAIATELEDKFGAQIDEQHKEHPEFKPRGKDLVDYLLIQGKDPTSQGKIIIQMGNKPKVKSRPWFSKERTLVSKTFTRIDNV